MRKVIVLQGVSGAGKTTYAQKLLEDYGMWVACASADHYFLAHEYAFKASELPKAHAYCLRNFIRFVEGGADLVVVDNTNTTAVEIAPYMAIAQAYGYEAEIHRLLCDTEVAAQRNVHGVPANSIRAMASRMRESRTAFPPRWKVVDIGVEG